jgi:hypothetical protein
VIARTMTAACQPTSRLAPLGRPRLRWASERASLAHDLILTLDDTANLELSPQQEREIGRRVRLVQDGKAAGRSAEEIFSDIRAKHSR